MSEGTIANTTSRRDIAAGEDSLVDGISEWLIDQALGHPDIFSMFSGTCERVNGAGIPVTRGMITYQTLHPTVEIEMAVWRRGEGVEFEQYDYRTEEPESFRKSPLKFLLDANLGYLRRRLAGPEATLDFPVLKSFAESGYTDYFALSTQFATVATEHSNSPRGVLMSWCTDRPGGFSNTDIAALQRLQRRFAVACKTLVQSDISRNVARTYLGVRAADRVLSGNIRRGDGEETSAVVWYSDIHGSTALADTMDQAAYLHLLNDYFECTAGAVVKAGGEVLDFIGDAVLGIFPVESEADIANAGLAASEAVADALEQSRETLARRKNDGLRTFEFSVALNLGSVMFGNIGIPQRLSFSVIGPTVNEVARMEKMTRTMNVRAVATEAIAKAAPDYWADPRPSQLAGVAAPLTLFAWQG